MAGDNMQTMDTEPTKMNIMVNQGADGQFRFYALHTEIAVGQCLMIPVSAEGGMDCQVMWVGEPFQNGDETLVEFRIVSVEDVDKFNKLLDAHKRKLH